MAHTEITVIAHTEITEIHRNSFYLKYERYETVH